MTAPNPLGLLAAQLAQTILAAAQDANTEAWAVGVVTNVDASSNATVSWRGGSLVVKRNANYTPVVNDVVLMAHPKDQLVIVCKIV